MYIYIYIYSVFSLFIYFLNVQQLLMGAQTAKMMSVFCRSLFLIFFLNSSTLNLDLKNSVCMPCNDKLMKECHTFSYACFFGGFLSELEC